MKNKTLIIIAVALIIFLFGFYLGTITMKAVQSKREVYTVQKFRCTDGKFHQIPIK